MSEEFKTAFSRLIGKQSESNIASVGLQHVVLPIAIAIMGAATPYLWNISPYIPIIIWLFVVLVYALSWWRSSPTYNDVHGLLVQKHNDDLIIDKLNKEVNYLEDELEKLYFKNMASFAYRVMSVRYIQNINKNGMDIKYFSELLDEMLSPFYLQGDYVFGFEISENWSISVYLFDSKNNILKSVWRKKSTSHPSAGLGRDWIPGEGHVGKAFLDRRPILTGNANDEAVSQLCRARGSKQLDYDRSAYISFASVPLAISEDDNEDPYGVLVVTSDREDRFSEEATTELLMHAAETIAVIFELSGADMSCFFNANHDINKSTQGGENVGSAKTA